MPNGQMSECSWNNYQFFAEKHEWCEREARKKIPNVTGIAADVIPWVLEHLPHGGAGGKLIKVGSWRGGGSEKEGEVCDWIC